MICRLRPLPVLSLVLAFTATVVAAAMGAPLGNSSSGEANAPFVGADNALRATLANGLRVVIVRNALAPVVATAVNYQVGSDEAPKGFPGMAHAQEHMMFRGSPGLSADQLAEIGNVMGGNFNANTRESLTQYLYTVPSEDIDLALNIEASRMRDVSDRQEDWDKERGAIEQEVARDLSDPFYALYEKLRAQMFAGTVYEHDALGTRPSFDRTSAAMLKDFHDKWYAPNNAILVIVGDVNPSATLAKVRELFGPIPSRKIPLRPTVTLQPFVPQSLHLETDRPDTAQVVAFRMPGLDSPDFPVMEVLADILESQRFDFYGLVAQGWALSANVSLDPLPQAGLGYVTITFPAGDDPRAFDSAIRKILAKVVRDGVPPELVAAAKIQERRQAEFQKNSIANQASIWSDAIALYGLTSPDADLKRIEKVTVADVNRVARAYLDPKFAVSATMTPHESGKAVAGSAGFGGQEAITLEAGKTIALPPWAETALNRLRVPPSTLHPIESRLANGLRLIVVPETVSDTVTVYGHIRNRPETEEPAGREGVSLLLNRLLSFGTQELDREAFQEALDAIGAEENAGTNFSIKILAHDFDRGAALLADNELRPALPQAATGLIKNQIAQAVMARNRSPAYLAQRSIALRLYPDGDPSLRQATSATVLGLSRADVLSFYKNTFRPDLTTIVVVGNLTPARVRAVIEKFFGGWKAYGPKPRTDLPSTPPNPVGVVEIPDASRIQDNVALVQNLALTRANRDYYPLALGNAVLGGGFYATRLSIDLRKNAGLVYSVSADIQPGRTRSLYLVRYASDPANVAKAAEAIAREIHVMQDSPAAVGELNRAKALLLEEIPLQESSVDQIAQSFTNRADLNLPLEEPRIAARRYIALTPVQVQSAFRKWMRPDDLVRVSQGPPSL